MRFYIEMIRHAKGAILVTLRDGPVPVVGELLRDEAGALWRVIFIHPTEVELVPLAAHPPGEEAVPEGKMLVDMHAPACCAA